MADYQTIETIARGSDRFNDLLILTGGSTVSLLERYGLLMNKGYPQIGRAETLSMLVSVPGAGRPLDLSRSLDGKLHYTKRQITVQMSCFRPRSQWDTIQKDLEALLHGQWVWFRFRPDVHFWRGYLTVSAQPWDHGITFTVKGICNPYHYNMTAYLGGDWLWDTFDFEEDTIYDTPTEVKKL